MKLVINRCYGGFGLSTAAYKRLIELGIPVRDYVEQERDPVTGLWLPEPANDGEVIFRNNPGNLRVEAYWDSWTREARGHPLLVQVVEELGDKASGRLASLAVVEVPDGVDYTIEGYGGSEHVAEVHRTWA